ncbi:CPBP family intramembrane metalloprotease [Nocardia sp. CDC159]|uniref:CPBP family intramembrane metalloprotease n=1 Tax=Nocardia pulmonis TaxID=2951408 RepID=A0A9X2IUK3_9NOCA|nr:MULTISPECIES: CPBP family intramembrane glutamic endopeptidase [Nocardia]MCM6772957.1 CPBP family intramembrane metalloprotease [Nocardia pulmonis]MCM6785740.1 CPBP family intramembrane metalloprotease [Nocardia sp. CDC159]
MTLPLLWSNRVLPRLHLGIRGRTVANTAFATGYGLAFGRGVPIGRVTRRPITTFAPAAAVLAGYGVALAIPSLRARLTGFAERAPEVPVAEWAAVHIPLGTVYSEELIFRAILDPLLDEAAGPLGPWLGATTFGLWHIAPARAAGDDVPLSVAATTLGGLFLGWQRRRTGGILAPALLHLALNAGGAIAPHLAARMVGTNRAGGRANL